MNGMHLSESDLARLSDGGDGAANEHLCRCARCRSAAADYRWLEGEMAATLATAARAVVAPRPRWWAVRAQLVAGRRRQAAGWRLSAVASAALIISLVLLAPLAADGSLVAQTLLPGAAIAPAPVTMAVPAATATPAVYRNATSAQTPVLGPLPTPPEPGV